MNEILTKDAVSSKLKSPGSCGRVDSVLEGARLENVQTVAVGR